MTVRKTRVRRWLGIAIGVAVLAWLLVRSEPSRRPQASVAVEHRAAAAVPTPARPDAPPAGTSLGLPSNLPRLLLDPAAVAAEPVPIPLERFYLERDDAYCRRDCPPRGVRDDAQSCRAYLAIAGRLLNTPYVEGVRDGRLTYDPLAAGRCVRDLGLCGDDDKDTPACSQVFRGHSPEGAVCQVNEECANRDCQKPHSPISPGVCAPKPRSDQTCTRDSDCPGEKTECMDGQCLPWGATPGARCKIVCDADLWCDFTATKPVCHERLAEGKDCQPGTPSCRDDLYCRALPLGGRCARPRDEGQSCHVDGVEESCLRGLECVPLPGGSVCLRSQKAGGPCRHDLQCDLDFRCLGATTAVPGRCVGLPTESEPCGTASAGSSAAEWRCRSPFVCHPQRRLCVRELTEGDACPAATCGMANFERTCVAGFCRSRLDLGAACVPDSDDVARCRFGLRCVDGHCAPW